MKMPGENKGLAPSAASRHLPHLEEHKMGEGVRVQVRLLSDAPLSLTATSPQMASNLEGKKKGEVVFVDRATAERLIAGYYAELAEE